MNTSGMTHQELKNYRTNGFVVRQSSFAIPELQQLRDAVDQVATQAAANASTGKEYILDEKRFVDMSNCTIQFEFPQDTDQARVIEPVDCLHHSLDKLVDDLRLTSPIRTILERQDLALWTAKLNLKRAGGAGFGWHQDSPYWIHDCCHDVGNLPNVMLLLDDQNQENGCFNLIPGSHSQGVMSGTDDGSQLGGYYTDERLFNSDNAYHCELPAGSLVFFDPHIVHGSAANQSSSARRALIYTYQPADHPTLKNGYVRNVV